MVGYTSFLSSNIQIEFVMQKSTHNFIIFSFCEKKDLKIYNRSKLITAQMVGKILNIHNELNICE